jgi:hypothetical protein
VLLCYALRVDDKADGQTELTCSLLPLVQGEVKPAPELKIVRPQLPAAMAGYRIPSLPSDPTDPTDLELAELELFVVYVGHFGRFVPVGSMLSCVLFSGGRCRAEQGARRVG